ncbi:MAG: hypothetical protein R3A51_10820 [Nannocystaceae bacterium]
MHWMGLGGAVVLVSESSESDSASDPVVVVESSVVVPSVVPVESSVAPVVVALAADSVVVSVDEVVSFGAPVVAVDVDPPSPHASGARTAAMESPRRIIS